MMNELSRLLAATLMLVPMMACGSATGNPSTAGNPPDLSGHWKSACTKTGDAQSVLLDFTLGTSAWALDYTTYGDATCAAPFVTVHIEGPYALTAKSALVPGAWEGRFGFTKKTLAPHTDAAAAFLGSSSGCGGGTFAIDNAADVYATGCAGLGQYPSAQCSADYDVVSISGNTLRFGDRPKDNNMCTEANRPKALSQIALTRTP